jgi:hypothetical protein
MLTRLNYRLVSSSVGSKTLMIKSRRFKSEPADLNLRATHSSYVEPR